VGTKGITHDEDLSSERAAMFPLLIVSNHPRWRTHAQGDDNSWARETPTGKVLGFDGYNYEPVWINPVDAQARVSRTATWSRSSTSAASCW